MSFSESVQQMRSPPYEDASMHPEFHANISPTNPPPLEQMLHAMFLQINNTNQALMTMLAQRQEQTIQRDPKIRPKTFSGLPTEDVLTWLDHFDNVASYHQWDDPRKALEARTLFENIAATWFIQQDDTTKNNWHLIKEKLVENFANQDIAQTALHQLQHLRQQTSKPIAQFGVKLNQLLLRVDPAMSDKMKLFLLWPRMRHDLARRVRDQAPKTFQTAIQIAQIIESSTIPDITNPPSIPVSRSYDPGPSPMDIDVQNAQIPHRRSLPDRDRNGRPRCFHCNLYGHVRKLKLQQGNKQHSQNAQINWADAASLAELPGNI